MTEQEPPVAHAVIPAAGRGMRFLPVTKTVPREMLPIVDRPTIDYVMRELYDVGLEDVLFIARAGKQSIEDYFDADPIPESELEKSGKDASLALVKDYQELPGVHSTRQGHPLRLGHAILQAKAHVGDASFVVMLPDDLMEPGAQLLRRMIEVRVALGDNVIALTKVTREQVTAYASVACTPTDIPEGVQLAQGALVHVGEVVEKPKLGDVKSEYAAIDRYVLDAAVFDASETIEPGVNNEYRLTDGYAKMIDLPAEEGGGVYGVVIDERRFDTGDKLGYLKATIALALKNPELGAELRAFLEDELDGAR